MEALDGTDAVVHLSGAGIGDHRWTDAYRRELRASRIASTELLVSSLATLPRPPPVLLCASAIGWYGARGDEILDEASTAGTGFLAELCRDWEAATTPAARIGVRVVRLRSGVVISPDGGALRRQLPLFRLGLGGRFGAGTQWLSWISIADQVGAMEWLLSNDVEGPVNVTAPSPVTNAEFTRELAGILHRPAVLRVPRLGPALLMGSELADSLLYTGQRAVPAVLERGGYRFIHPDLGGALRALLAR
jgi:uncharacterized protein (TIGR01777 family)